MRRLAALLSIAAATALASSDAARAQPAPRPQPAPPQQPPAEPKRFEVTIDDPMLAPPSPASRTLGSWEEARRLAVSASTELLRADASVARADAQVRQQRASLYPTARATAEVELDLLHPRTPPASLPAGTSPLGTVALSLTQPLFDVPARHGRAAAHADRRAAVLDRVEADRRITHRIARAAVAVLAAERAAEINRVGLRQALERAALGRRTHDLGAATELDALRTEQDVAVARSALIAGDEQLRAAREALGLALGVDGDVGVAPALAGGALAAQIEAACRPQPDAPRADVEAAHAAIDAARARTEQARAGYLPTIDLTSNLFAYTSDDPVPGRVPTWTIGAVLSIPIWEGGLRAGLVAERRAAEADARAVAAGVERSARVEIAQASRGERVGAALVEAAAESARLAGRVDAMTRRSFELGRATSLELVQSAVALRQAELTLALREFDRAAAEIDHLLSEARCVR